jgi:hypothetical protein
MPTIMKVIAEPAKLFCHECLYELEIYGKFVLDDNGNILHYVRCKNPKCQYNQIIIKLPALILTGEA